MKKFIILMLVFLSLLKSYSQSVGIGTTAPNTSSMLDVSATNKGMLVPRMTTVQRTAIASPAKGLLVFDNDVSSFFFYNGTAWTQLSAGSSTNFWSANGSDISNINSGSVGIGTTTPISKLGVKTATGNYGLTQTDGTVTVGTYVNANLGWFGTRSNHPLTFFTNDGGPSVTLATNGNFGMGTANPINRLQIGDAPPYSGYDFVIKDKSSSSGMAFLQNSTSTQWWTYLTDIFLNPSLGHVGIGILSAANKLQIGSVGATGFNGNDVAIGNGTNAMGIFQSNTATQFASSTNIVFLPNVNNGQGNVGINTSTPRAPLEVDGNLNQTSYNQYNQYAYYTLGFNNFNPVDLEGGTAGSIPNVSIYASNRIMATEFDAYSDARIKTVTGISDNWKDLETLNALRITDYTMKDKVKYGNKPFKKVIAQQVEKVYPQVVSKHTDFIPNVYQAVSKIEKTSNGYLLHFNNNHNITHTAKKLQVLLSGKNQMEEYNIVAIPNDKEVIIETTDLNADKIFVYGEEVNDFRTVDYEGLTTLNISATQELGKLIAMQNKKIEALEREIKLLQSKRD